MFIRLSTGKKGMMGMGMMSPRKGISFVVGLVFFALGLIPLLKMMNVIHFTIPPFGNTIVIIICLIGAVFLLWDAIDEGQFGMAMGAGQMLVPATVIMALALLALGLIPLLHTMNVIGFTIPQLGQTIMDVLYVITGVLLFYGGTQGM
jgi:hypothetical protein